MIHERSIKECPPTLLSGFDCGEEHLNLFLSSYAKQNDEKGYGRTFVLLEDDALIGFYTLASAQIEFAHIPGHLLKNLPRYPAPAIRIARLAVRKRSQGKGYGAILLKYAFKRILLAAINAGIAFVLVDAKESARGFYEHYGFVRLTDESNLYVMPIATMLKAVVG